MRDMFNVRFARVLAPPALSRALPVHAACVAATQRPHASRARTASRIACPPFDSAVYASAFNQALGFNTSKVTDMRYMFDVRSARALPPQRLESGHFPVHTPLALPSLHALSPRIACSLLSTRQGSSGRLS